jgi:hypothetical protein
VAFGIALTVPGPYARILPDDAPPAPLEDAVSEPSQEPTHPLLIVTGPPRDGEALALESLGFEKNLGSGADCHLRLQAGNVDMLHARVVWEGRGVLLTDLGSAAGTYVNGEKIAADHLLQDGDRICLGPPGSKQTVKLLARIPAESSMPGPIVLAPEQDPFGLGEEPPALDLSPEPEPEAPKAVLMPPVAVSPPSPAPRPATPPPPARPAPPAPERGAAGAATPAIIFDTPRAAAPVASAPAPPPPAAPSRPRRPGPDVTELPSIAAAPAATEGEADAAPLDVEEAPARPRLPRPPRQMPSVPPVVWIGLAAVLVAAGGAAAWMKLRPVRPVLTALAPQQAEARQALVLTGTGFDAQPRGNTVRVGKKVADVTAATATQVTIMVPPDLEATAADVPVTIETRGGQSNPVFLRVKRLPRGLKLETDVALPGGEVTVTGQNLEVKPLMVRVAGIPADVVEASAASVRFRVPSAVPFEEGRSVPVILQVGADSSPAVPLLLGRLPLVAELSPRTGRAGDRVTIRGRGFDPQAAGNAVTFGTEPALVLAASETELVAVVPYQPGGGGQLEVPVAVKAHGSASAGGRAFAVQKPSAAVYVPHFFAAPVPEDPGGERVFVATELGPVLLLSGRAEAASAAERAAQAAAALNAAFAARTPLELREAPSPAIAARGKADAIATATAADAAAYAPPIAPAGTARVSPRVLAGHWVSVLQDLQALFVDRQRPVRVVQGSPKGKVLLDLYAEGERLGGAGAGVPTRLVDPLPFTVGRAFREMALAVPAPGQTSAAAAVTGVWRGTMEEDGVGQRPMQLSVHLDGTRLAGAITSRSGKVGMEIPVLDLAYDKGVLSFRTTSGAAARRYRATLDGATLAGTIHGADAQASAIGRFTLRYTE